MYLKRHAIENPNEANNGSELITATRSGARVSTSEATDGPGETLQVPPDDEVPQNNGDTDSIASNHYRDPSPVPGALMHENERRGNQSIARRESKSGLRSDVTDVDDWEEREKGERNHDIQQPGSQPDSDSKVHLRGLVNSEQSEIVNGTQAPPQQWQDFWSSSSHTHSQSLLQMSFE